MPIDPVKIPSNVQIEEKIFGPVSLRQIFIMMVTGGFSYIIWTVGQRNGYNGIPYTVASFIPLYIGAAFAFVKINDISLMRLIFLSFERLQKPTVRSFGPRPGISINIRTNADDQEMRLAQKETIPDKHMELLSALLDKGRSSVDEEVDEVEIPVTEPSRPVNPTRIQAQPLSLGETVDGMRLEDDEHMNTSSSTHTLLRDILPPTA